MTPSYDWELELSSRFTRIFSYVTAANCEALLVYASRDHAEPFRYLINFVPNLGDMWAIAPVRDRNMASCFLNFNWELAEATRVSGIASWYGSLDPIPSILTKIKRLSAKRIAVLGLDRIPWRAYQAICSSCTGLEMVDIQPEFNRIRRIKTPFEIHLLKEAARITDLALDEIREIARPGLTEKEIAAQILFTFYRQGAEAAFTPLVMGGMDAETAEIARSARSRPIENGDTLMLDIGAAYQGYQVDVARTMVLGNPNAQQQKVWDTILRAYDAVFQLAQPEIPCCKLHETARKIFQEGGYNLVHRIGHGIGLATSFEWPSLDSEPAALQPGMTLAIEPGIYTPGAGAMKLEDSIVITETGCEVISSSRRDL
jgi:Xaa-Pro aminopeptidase